MAAKTSEKPSEHSRTLRAGHLRHETSLRMFGLLYYIASGLLGVTAIACVVIKGSMVAGRFGAMLAMVAAGHGLAGFHLRRFDARGRYSATLMAVLGLVALPVGTVLSAYVLYLIHSTQGRTILSPDYRAVIQATPEIRGRVTNSVLALGIALVGVTIYGLFRSFMAANA